MTNRDVGVAGVRRLVGRLAYRLRHLLHRNTRTGSRRKYPGPLRPGQRLLPVVAGPEHDYSSAWFQGDLAGDLTAAQHAKVRRALHSAGVRYTVLEIGCGWGALAEMAAGGEFQAHVTGVTLSNEQLALASSARQRRRAGGLRAELRLQDYRDIQTPFDAICSIEMVPRPWARPTGPATAPWRACSKLGGRACVQSIVIDDALFERYVQGTDSSSSIVFPRSQVRPGPARQRRRSRPVCAWWRSWPLAPTTPRSARRWHRQFTQQHAQVLAQVLMRSSCANWEFYRVPRSRLRQRGSIDAVQYTLVKN